MPRAAQMPADYGPPFKPRKRLAIGLLVAFFAWMAVLWVMYFATVYPLSHKGERTGSQESEHLQTVPR